VINYHHLFLIITSPPSMCDLKFIGGIIYLGQGCHSVVAVYFEFD